MRSETRGALRARGAGTLRGPRLKLRSPMLAALLASTMALLPIAAPPAQAQTSNDATLSVWSLQPRYSRDATLSALALTDASGNAISFTETFSRTKYAYTANVDFAAAAVKVTATVNHPEAYVRVIGTADYLQRNAGRLFYDDSVALTSGSASDAMNLSYGANTITVVVQAKASDERNYTITVNRARPPQDRRGQQPSAHADLIAQMYEWRNDPQWASYKSHTDRWDRALLAFGEEVDDPSLTAMAAAEAQGYAARGWQRWVPVGAALEELESAVQSPQQQDPSNRAPTVAVALADVTIVNEGGTRTVFLTGAFSDADGDALTITARSSNEAVATVSVSSDGSSLTVRGVAEGEATVTLTAQDPNGNSVLDDFHVTVEPDPEAESSDIVARYDANGDGSIDTSEYRQAARDYTAGTISYLELLEVVRAYLAP